MEEHVHSENCTHDHVRGETQDVVHLDVAANWGKSAPQEMTPKEMRRRTRNHRKAVRNKARASARSKYERRLVRDGATVKQLVNHRKNETHRTYGRRHIRRAAAKHLKQLQVAMRKKERSDQQASHKVSIPNDLK